MDDDPFDRMLRREEEIRTRLEQGEIEARPSRFEEASSATSTIGARSCDRTACAPKEPSG